MKETLIAVVVTALFVASGRFAIAQSQRSRTRAVRTDYALHVVMAVVMILMSWIPLPGVVSTFLAVAFGGATVWFVGYAVRGPGGVATRRFRMIAGYHAFMMAAMALMLVAMGPHHHSPPTTGLPGGHHEPVGASTTLGDMTTVLGIVLGIVAAFWIARAARGLRLDVPARRPGLARLRLYELAMAAGMALMSLSHQALG